jgi:predicted nucleic acid-binding protein
MTAAVACVVDASVGIKLFLAEELSDRADALFAHLAADQPGQLSVPDLFYIECANILWKHTRRSGYPTEKAHKALTDLGQLALKRYPTAGLAAQALDVAIDRSITAYDACYVALALQLSVPFVTGNEKLTRALSGTKHPQVHWLGDFPIPPVPPQSF